MQTWRFIDSGLAGAAYNMALDEALSTTARAGGAPPALRFYGWEGPAVSLGCFQPAHDVDLDYCTAAGITVVRRPTGGRAILHVSDELTYSFSASFSGQEFSGSLFESYGALSRAFCLGFRQLGLAVDVKTDKKSTRPRSALCFQSASYGELSIAGRKIIGSAQRRWPDGLLQQGSIPFAINNEELGRVFRGGGAAAFAGLTEAAPGITVPALKRALRAAFEEVFHVRLVEEPIFAEERALVEELVETKYLNPSWTFRK